MIHEKELWLVQPDPRPDATPFYKYSNGLFYFFYGRMKYLSDCPTRCWMDGSIDVGRTMKDNSEGGCRIWLASRGYCVLYEYHYLMEFHLSEWQHIEKISIQNGKADVTVADVVDYYYIMNP